MIRVAVAGAAGRMGRMVCDAVSGADDLSLTGQADPLRVFGIDQALIQIGFGRETTAGDVGRILSLVSGSEQGSSWLKI